MIIQTTQKSLTLDGKTKLVNQSTSVMCFRLVHDGKKVLSLFEANGVTYTINFLYCATTNEEIQTEITSLQLIPLPEQNPTVTGRNTKT